MLLVLPDVTENGSFWQQPKSLYSLAHLRQLVGWEAHQHAIVNNLQAAQPQKKLAVYSSRIQSTPEHTTEIWKDMVLSMKGS